MPTETPFDLKFTSREVTAWGGLALLKRMMDGMGFKSALQSWELPQPGSNRGYRPEQLIEQMIVSIWCGAARFAHADITRLDTTVLTRWGNQIKGGAKGFNPKNKGRASHHPLMAFVADWRLVANFWLRPGNTASSNNTESFIESTLENLGETKVGLFRADSGFYDKAIVALLKAKKISHIISARLTQALQQAIFDHCKWQQVEPGLDVSELNYQPHGWQSQQRLVVVRQHIQRKGGAVAGKTLSLFADDPDLQGWRYGAMLTDLRIPALEVWRLYRGRADCENRIKELKADFGLSSFVLRDFWATEAALGVTMLAYNLMSVFRHAVMRQKVHHTLSTLHHQVLAVGAIWDDNAKNTKQTFRLAVARKRRPWFEGLWTHAGEPVKLTPKPANA